MKVVLSALLFIAYACWGGMQTEKITVTDLGYNWYQHDQFGTFYDANNSSWYYHLDHGWLYVDEWDDNGTWMYMPVHDEYYYPESNYSALPKQVSPGWMWSKAIIYPQLYSDLIKGWMYGYGKGIFYDYRTKYRYGNGFGHLELDFTDSNKTTEEIREKMDAYFFFYSHGFENDPYAELALPFDHGTEYRPFDSLTTISISFPLEILSADNNWSKLVELCEENPNEMNKRGIVKIEKDEGVVSLVSFTVSLLKGITFPHESILKINVPGTRKWQNAYVTVEGASLKFSGSASNVGDVVLENVNHPNIGTLSGSNFPEVTSGL